MDNSRIKFIVPFFKNSTQEGDVEIYRHAISSGNSVEVVVKMFFTVPSGKIKGNLGHEKISFLVLICQRWEGWASVCDSENTQHSGSRIFPEMSGIRWDISTVSRIESVFLIVYGQKAHAFQNIQILFFWVTKQHGFFRLLSFMRRIDLIDNRLNFGALTA